MVVNSYIKHFSSCSSICCNRVCNHQLPIARYQRHPRHQSQVRSRPFGSISAAIRAEAWAVSSLWSHRPQSSLCPALRQKADWQTVQQEHFSIWYPNYCAGLEPLHVVATHCHNHQWAASDIWRLCRVCREWMDDEVEQSVLPGSTWQYVSCKHLCFAFETFVIFVSMRKSFNSECCIVSFRFFFCSSSTADI